jgi:hypothetical protein
LNERIAYGNLTPKQLGGALKILEALDSLELKDSEGHSVFEFSDNTEANPTKLFQEFLSSYPKFVEFSEIAVSRQEKENNKENKSQSEIVADEIRKQMSEKTI